MRLYFLRHGKAADRETWEGDDAVRPLTDEGREETRRAARGLAALALGVERMLSSPYVRARETADLTAAALGLAVEEVTELASGCDLGGLAHVLGSAHAAQQVMLVGHEPDFSTLIGQLIAGREGAAIALKKGACCRVDLADRAAESAARDPRRLLGRGELIWLLTPKQLALLAPARTTSMRGQPRAKRTDHRPS